MTYDELNSQLLNALDSIDQIKLHQRLLVMASKEDDYTRENFDNIHLLLELYQEKLDCHLSELAHVVNKTHKAIRRELWNSQTA